MFDRDTRCNEGIMEKQELSNIIKKCATQQVANTEILPDIAELLRSMNKSPWPNQISRAVADKNLLPFIGAGVSAAADIKMWRQLLAELKLPDGLLDEAPHDSLTPAEIAKLRTGSERVQDTLRQSVSDKKTTITHVLLAMLNCPIFITTNYDKLIEDAIRIATGVETIPIIANDSDLIKHVLTTKGKEELSLSEYRNHNQPIIVKIHGCALKRDEHLVFTRSDYRTHYRANDLFFRNIRELLSRRHVLFIGFSHTDPEVGRLLEDAMYLHEERLAHAHNGTDIHKAMADSPHLYSTQLQEKAFTRDLFAAQGITPIIIPQLPKHYSNDVGSSFSIRIATAIGQLVLSKPESDALDVQVAKLTSAIAEDLTDTLAFFTSEIHDEAMEVVRSSKSGGMKREGDSLCETLRKELRTERSSQGVWLLNASNEVVGCSVPEGQDKQARLQHICSESNLEDTAPARFPNRPYIQVAKSFREPFVSDGIMSIFNGHVTIFICRPIVEKNTKDYKGLLFSATQPGHWKLPLTRAQELAGTPGQTLILCSSDGVPLLPFELDEKGELSTDKPDLPPVLYKMEEQHGKDTVAKSNVGFSYKKLERQALQSTLVRKVKRIIIPSMQVNTQLKQLDTKYDIVAQFVPRTPWKLAIARTRTGSGDEPNSAQLTNNESG